MKVPATPVGPRFFKAVTLYGLDFHTRTVPWLPPDGAPIPEGGWLVEHSHPEEVGIWNAAFYLSASTVETDCTGFQWPARLLSVEPVGDVWTPHPDKFPRKRAAHAWRVIGELPAWRLFGPQGREVAAIIEQAANLTSAQIAALIAAMKWDLDAAYDAAWGAAWGAVRVAARDAAWGAVRDADLGAVWVASRDAALGWLVKDLISVEDFRTMTGPWEQVVGPIEVAA
ncbi:hypothetical protein EFN21_08315 [Propionibacterium freudenreichii]|nr:hypothetical protein [Propionibacterium freudenreichii]